MNTAQYYTYIDVINVKDFGLEEQPQRSGLLDGVSKLTVCLRTGTRKHTFDVKLTELKWGDTY